MTKEPDCGFSCTYAKSKTYKMLQDLMRFSEYDPNNAMNVINEISQNVEYVRRVVYDRYMNQ